MPNTIRIKRRTTGSPGAPSSLANAELAYNEVDPGNGILYYGKGTGGVGGTASAVIAVGGDGAFVSLSGNQTITGGKTFTGSVDLTGGNATAATQLSSDNSTKLATTAFVKAQSYLTGNQSISLSGDATGSGTTSIAVTLANTGTAGTYTKVTTDAKGRVTAGASLSATDIPSLTASKISDFDTQVRLSRLDQLAAPTASLSLNNQTLTNLATPVNASDACTKGYADNLATGLDVKASCRVLAASNITLSGTQTIDGVSLAAGDRVLVSGQSTASQNGIYVVAAGVWSRAADADNSPSGEVTSGMFTFIEEGTTYAATGWVLQTANPISLGSTGLSFAQFSGAGQITAGNGLNKAGSSLSVVGTTNRITVSASGVDIASTYAGQNTIATVGTLTSGTWNANVIGVAYGGTGTTAITGLVKGNGSSAFTAAVDGTDYLSPSATVDGGTF